MRFLSFIALIAFCLPVFAFAAATSTLPVGSAYATPEAASASPQVRAAFLPSGMFLCWSFLNNSADTVGSPYRASAVDKSKPYQIAFAGIIHDPRNVGQYVAVACVTPTGDVTSDSYHLEVSVFSAGRQEIASSSYDGPLPNMVIGIPVGVKSATAPITITGTLLRDQKQIDHAEAVFGCGEGPVSCPAGRPAFLSAYWMIGGGVLVVLAVITAGAVLVRRRMRQPKPLSADSTIAPPFPSSTL